MTLFLAATPIAARPIAAAPPALPHTSDNTQLLIAVLLSIGAIVLLITRLKLHPFLALTLGSGLLAAVAGAPSTS